VLRWWSCCCASPAGPAASACSCCSESSFFFASLLSSVLSFRLSSSSSLALPDFLGPVGVISLVSSELLPGHQLALPLQPRLMAA
jgi:hypothetical protein